MVGYRFLYDLGSERHPVAEWADQLFAFVLAELKCLAACPSPSALFENGVIAALHALPPFTATTSVGRTFLQPTGNQTESRAGYKYKACDAYEFSWIKRIFPRF